MRLRLERATVAVALLLTGCDLSENARPADPSQLQDAHDGDRGDGEGPGFVAGHLMDSNTESDPGFEGVGVIKRRTRTLPTDAPAWATVVAEVIEQEGQRYLRATGYSPVQNPSLARTSASNRARAVLAQWLQTETLHGSEITDVVKTESLTYARAQIPLPDGWEPPRRDSSLGRKPAP